MPEYTLTIYNDSIELTCDECGHVNHWPSGIELDEVWANADIHTDEQHKGE
jgi:hypothetical protein